VNPQPLGKGELKLSKWIIGCIIIVAAPFLMFNKSAHCSPPEVTDYNFNTIFASVPYSDSKLSSIKPGTNKAKVRELLGEPLYIKQINFLHCLLFTNGNAGLDPSAAEFHGVGGNGKDLFLGIWFSEEDKVNFVFNNGFTKMNKAELIGLDSKRIFELLGRPKESLRIPKHVVYSYSKIKEGPYTGDDHGIYIRRIYFNASDQVVTVDMSEGSETDYYSGIIESPEIKWISPTRPVER